MVLCAAASEACLIFGTVLSGVVGVKASVATFFI